jgi:hypothetical protein
MSFIWIRLFSVAKTCGRVKALVGILWPVIVARGGSRLRCLVLMASLGGEISSRCSFVMLLFLRPAMAARGWIVAAPLRGDEALVPHLDGAKSRRLRRQHQMLLGSCSSSSRSSTSAPLMAGSHPHAKINDCRAAAPSLLAGVRWFPSIDVSRFGGLSVLGWFAPAVVPQVASSPPMQRSTVF